MCYTINDIGGFLATTFSWQHPGRESLKLELEMNGDSITDVKMKARGCLSFLLFSQKMKASLKGPAQNLDLPHGHSHSELIWKEMIQRIQNQWKDPINHKELCHCRQVDADVVDRAVVYGAHTVEDIRKRTSANTGCATCLPDVQKVLKNRLA